MGSESGDDVFSGMGEGGEVEEEGHDSTLEESFTIHLGKNCFSQNNQQNILKELVICTFHVTLCTL